MGNDHSHKAASYQRRIVVDAERDFGSQRYVFFVFRSAHVDSRITSIGYIQTQKFAY